MDYVQYIFFSFSVRSYLSSAQILFIEFLFSLAMMQYLPPPPPLYVVLFHAFCVLVCLPVVSNRFLIVKEKKTSFWSFSISRHGCAELYMLILCRIFSLDRPLMVLIFQGSHIHTWRCSFFCN